MDFLIFGGTWRGGGARPPYLDTFEGVRAEDLGGWLALEMLSRCKGGEASRQEGVSREPTQFSPTLTKHWKKELKTLDDDNWKCLRGS